MKNKNPLYVIKGKDVEEASSVFDLVIKKFNLGPVLEILNNLFKMLLENVKSWPTFVAIKNIIDELMNKYSGIFRRFGVVGGMQA